MKINPTKVLPGDTILVELIVDDVSQLDGAYAHINHVHPGEAIFAPYECVRMHIPKPLPVEVDSWVVYGGQSTPGQVKAIVGTRAWLFYERASAEAQDQILPLSSLTRVR